MLIKSEIKILIYRSCTCIKACSKVYEYLLWNCQTKSDVRWNNTCILIEIRWCKQDIKNLKQVLLSLLAIFIYMFTKYNCIEIDIWTPAVFVVFIQSKCIIQKCSQNRFNHVYIAEVSEINQYKYFPGILVYSSIVCSLYLLSLYNCSLVYPKLIAWNVNVMLLKVVIFN